MFQRVFLLGALIAGLISTLCFAQAVSGNLIGLITDSSGAVVPGAAVSAANTSTNATYNGQTNGSGQYRISNLPPGTYDVTVSATGLSKAILRGVSVQLNLEATANLTMNAGSVSTSIQVEEAAPQIDTTTAQLQSTFDAKQAADLPNVSTGQGVLNLSLLGAGVAREEAWESESGPPLEVSGHATTISWSKAWITTVNP